MNDNKPNQFRKKVVLKEPEERNNRQSKNMYGLKEQLEWIKRQLEYANFSEDYKLRFEVKRGQIFEFDWGVNVNAEFSNRHYGLVLRDSGPYDPLVYVCPLKTNKRGPNPASDVDLGYIPALKSEHRTLAVINQARALDKMRIYTKTVIGEESVFDEEIPQLDEKKMNLVLTALYVFWFSKGTGNNTNT